MLATRLRLLVATLWAGSLWTVGYVVAPTLFAALHDNTLAGTMVGHLLRSEAWLSIACALALLTLVWAARELDAKRRRALSLVVLAMLACTLVVYLGLQPVMGSLKEAAGAGGLKGTPQGTQFGILHAVSQIVYLVESVLAAVLIVKIR